MQAVINETKLYLRYIDDLFVIWDSHEKVKLLAEKFTLPNYGLKLKLEQCSKQNLHFLDIDIKVNGPSFSTKVYRKPNSPTLIIPEWSNDKWQHKKAALRSMIARAYTHCNSPELIREEINIIKTIASKHGYNNRLIIKIDEELEKRRGSLEQNEEENSIPNGQATNYEVIPHELRNSKTVKNILKRNNKKPAYRRPPTIFSLLRNVKDNYDKLEKSGVYHIPVENFDDNTEELYIGATSRNLKDRISEHQRDIKNARLSTALARRAYEGNVRIRWDECKVTKQVSNKHELFIAEEIQIYRGKYNTTVINDRQVNSLNKAWKYALNENAQGNNF